MTIRTIRNLCALLGMALTVVLCGCNSISDPGNYTYKEGIDYAQLKSYKLEPFSSAVKDLYPALSMQESAIYAEINRLLGEKGFNPAAEGAAADFIVRLSFSETQASNPDIRLIADPNALSYVPVTIPEGHLVVDIIVNGVVVYRSWSVWGTNMDNFNAIAAKQMVQWCLQKFPPAYAKPATPKIVQLKDE